MPQSQVAPGPMVKHLAPDVGSQVRTWDLPLLPSPSLTPWPIYPLPKKVNATIIWNSNPPEKATTLNDLVEVGQRQQPLIFLTPSAFFLIFFIFKLCLVETLNSKLSRTRRDSNQNVNKFHAHALDSKLMMGYLVIYNIMILCILELRLLILS